MMTSKSDLRSGDIEAVNYRIGVVEFVWVIWLRRQGSGSYSSSRARVLITAIVRTLDFVMGFTPVDDSNDRVGWSKYLSSKDR